MYDNRIAIDNFCDHRRPRKCDRIDDTYPVRVKDLNGRTHDISRQDARPESSSDALPFASMPSLKLCTGVAIRKPNAVRFASMPSDKLCTDVTIRNADKNSLALVDAVNVRTTHRVEKYKGKPLATVQRTWDSTHSGVYTYVDVARTRTYQAKRLKEAVPAVPAVPASDGNAANEEKARAAAAWVATAAKNDDDLFLATAAKTEPEKKEDDAADLEDAAVATNRLKTGNGSKQADESDDESDDDYDPE